MEAGDFDVTPAPSGRPSLSSLRRHDGDSSARNVSPSTRAAGPRYHLLKTSASGPTIVDREVLVPSVAAKAPLADDAAAPAPSPKIAPAYKPSITPVPVSALSAPSRPLLGDKGTPPPSRASHSSIRSPRGAFRDSGESGNPTRMPKRAKKGGLGDSESASSGSRRSSSTQTTVLRGSAGASAAEDDRKQAVSPAHDIYLGDFEGEAPRHEGPKHVSKVRPAHQYYPAYRPVISGEGHGLDYRPARNKVGPFNHQLEAEAKGEHEEIVFHSGSSTVVSLRDTNGGPLSDSPIQSVTTDNSSEARARFPKIRPALEDPAMECFGQGNMPLPTHSAAPSHEFRFFVSKVRPFLSSTERSGHVSPYLAAESKVRPMPDPESTRERWQGVKTESSGSSASLQHVPMWIPTTKAKPFASSALGAAESRQFHHRHLPKAQAFLDRPVPFDFQYQALPSSCVRCRNASEQEGQDVEERAATTAHPNETLESGTVAVGAPGPDMGKHSISVCDEYPTLSRPEPHSLDTCRQLAPSTGDDLLETSESQSQYRTPVPSRMSADHLVAAIPASIEDMESQMRDGLPSSQEIDPGSPVSDSRDDGFLPTSAFGAGHRRKREHPRPSVRFGALSEATESSGRVIYAPIPLSKVRPLFQDPGYGTNEGPTPLSKAKAMEDEPAASTTQDDEFFEIECGQSRHENENSPPAATSNNPSGRSHSLGSILDYKRTTQWLRDVLNHREAYTTKLTERPEKKKQEGQASLDGRRNSDPPQSDILSARRLSGTSVQTSRRKAKFDGYGFKTAVSDLERLLSEALSIASQVVDRPGTPPRKGYKPPSVSLHSHCRSISSANCNSDSSRLNLTSSLSQDVADDGEEVELDEVARSKRPTCRHAATYSGLPRRPRLNEIIQSYSSEGVEVGTREFPGEAEHANPAPHTGPQVSFEIPGRESTDMAAYPLATTSRVEAAAGSGSSEGLQSHPGHADAPRRHAKEIVVQLKPEQASGAARWHVGKRAARKPHESHGAARRGNEALPERDIAGRPMHGEHGISLRRRSHVSLRGAAGFNLAKSRKRQPTARDWSPIRKRFVAAVACISTALVGVILGIYAGLVPSIQYYIIDQSYATVHGNTGCFLGLAVPTFFLWPLPLLHGRKPYILSSLVLAMPLLFPQALAVNSQRLTHTGSWRSMLLVSRTLMGGCLGFASMNFHSMLTDLFGASLMSVNPHQEVVDQYDARRHGGGMGAWLGIWTWCWIGSLGLGFLIGACIIDGHQPTWGFYVSIVIIAAVLFLNVVCPEVRRSAFRRSIAEVRTGSDISRRIARGEIMMHRVKTGPKWWGQEAYHGVALSLEMLRQPGFAVLALYSAWIYAQVVLVIVLLGSLASRLYKLRSPAVGLLVGSMALGACLAIPFEKANVFSRSRQAQMNSNLATLNRKVAWSSHLVRRTVFTLLLPLAGICYAAVSSGPPLHVSVPTVFAAAIGFLSCLAIAECNGLVMETFDCSDLSPGMVGRQRSRSGKSQKLTNYSSFPRVTAGFAAIHGLAFVLAAGATALGGLVTRTLGQQVSTGVVASILFILTVTLLVVLIRFSDVQIIPKCKSEVMDKLVEARRRSSTRRASTPDDPQAIMEEERAWRPVMIGNPTGKKRRMNVLELGSLTRWQEIRKKNKLIDEGAHLNRAALDQGLEALDDQVSDLQREAREFFTRSGTRHKGSRHQRCTEDESGTADESVEMEEMEAAGEERVPHERWRFRERECVMSQTVGEESEGEGREARRGR